MNVLIVSDVEQWRREFPEYDFVSAREYLTNPRFLERQRARVINMCSSHGYQKTGYYVSLLATARGHKPLPSLATIQELKSPAIIRLATEELGELIESSFRDVNEHEVKLDIFFGKDPTARFDRLASALFRRFPAPLLRAVFSSARHAKRWKIRSCSFVSGRELEEASRGLVAQAAGVYLAKRPAGLRKKLAAYDLAILRDPDESEPPSDEEALRRFVKAAAGVGIDVDFLDRQDYGRLAQFDALFIRETTAVNHRTYRFAQRAAAEGLVVIDDPESILRCTNKVFLAEMLARYNVPTPPTQIVHRGNAEEVQKQLGLPCILKQPDSSFSQGVVKVVTPAQYRDQVGRLLKRSELVVAQVFMPTTFDWRIGVLNRRPIYACKYFMARAHWQIIKRSHPGQDPEEGPTEAVPLAEVPPAVVEHAVRAANLMGDGLYGVDLKQIGDRVVVIEVNDNPSIDAGSEDALLGQELYSIIMLEFRRRLDARRGAAA